MKINILFSRYIQMYCCCNYNQNINDSSVRRKKNMKNQRRTWTQKEDNLLASLVDKYNATSWQQIAAQLALESGSILPRNSKQCRQRWKNCLSPLNKRDWEIDQQILLLNLFEQYHTKWTKIASFMKQRNQFSVKSHFYAITRKSIRKLSKYMQQQKSIYRHVKSIPQAAVSKLLSLSGSHYQRKFEIQDDISMQLVQQTKRLLLLFMKSDEQWQNDKINELIKNLLFFSRNCRRRKKKKKILENMKVQQIAEVKLQKTLYSKAEQKRREQLWEKNVKVFPKSKTLPQTLQNIVEKEMIQDSQECLEESISNTESKKLSQNGQSLKQSSSESFEQKSQKFIENLKAGPSNFLPLKIEEVTDYRQCSPIENQYAMMNYFMRLQYFNALTCQNTRMMGFKPFY